MIHTKPRPYKMGTLYIKEITKVNKKRIQLFQKNLVGRRSEICKFKHQYFLFLMFTAIECLYIPRRLRADDLLSQIPRFQIADRQRFLK